MSVRLLVLAAPFAAVAAYAGMAPPAVAARSCSGGYQYAGVLAPRAAGGIGATLTLLASPQVRDGHVAAWVGIGGPGAGPGGSSEWLQVGLSGFAGGRSNLYYETKSPHGSPNYNLLQSSVRQGERHVVAVREVATRPGWWRVWVDGRPVSPPVGLPGSHRHWQPMAMTESWQQLPNVCNAFRYGFSHVLLAAVSGRGWRPFVSGAVLERGRCRILARRRNHFVGAGV